MAKEKEVLEKVVTTDNPSVPAGLENAESKDIIDYLFRLARGEAQLPEWMQYMGVYLPYVAMGAYYISYKISCKVYLKGVEQYEA